MKGRNISSADINTKGLGVSILRLSAGGVDTNASQTRNAGEFIVSS